MTAWPSIHIERAYNEAATKYREEWNRAPSNWDDVASMFDLKLCGCTDVHAVVRMIVELIGILEAEDWSAREEKMKGLGLDRDAHPGPFWLVLNMLNTADLIEHGGNISCSWATPKGLAFVEATKTFPGEAIGD